VTYCRTPEHRQAARERINRLQPWKKATGPKTQEGKVAASRNAYRGGVRPAVRMLGKVLSEQAQRREEILKERGT
jgi:hypothetical protein